MIMSTYSFVENTDKGCCDDLQLVIFFPSLVRLWFYCIIAEVCGISLDGNEQMLIAAFCWHVHRGMPLWTQKKDTKMIDDPTDKKPDDWEQPVTIPDPNVRFSMLLFDEIHSEKPWRDCWHGIFRLTFISNVADLYLWSDVTHRGCIVLAYRAFERAWQRRDWLRIIEVF